MVLDALGYSPPPVSPNAEVVDRRDLGEFTREKILFSTTPELRVPAYLHIPKNRKVPFPHRRSALARGMFLFGKEKVIDFGVNHPAMVEYHKQNYGGGLRRPRSHAAATW